MERQLPSYIIEGTEYLVDIEQMELRQADQPGNVISFISDMTDKGSHYDLIYDVERHRVYNRWLGYENDAWDCIRIPRMLDLDPVGMSAKYNIPISELAGKTDFEVIVDQQLLTQRRNGIIPKIRIGDEQFHVVLRENELWPSGHRGPTLCLDDLVFNEKAVRYEGYYHTIKKDFVEIEPGLTELPESVVAIRIPHDFKLDPIVATVIHGGNDYDSLRRYPIQKNLSAELIPLVETHLPLLVEQNRKAVKRESPDNHKRSKPKHRPRF